MRIAVLLTGICYSNGSERQPRDWRMCYRNILDFFSEIEVDFYLTTYNSIFNEELSSIFNPKKALFLDYGSSSQRETFIRALDNISDNETDFIFCTRFDIKFNKKISEFDIDYNRFNFLFREKNNWGSSVFNDQSRYFVTDNFFAFPIKYKSIFRECISNLDTSFYRKTTSHPLPFLHHVFDGSYPKLCDLVEYNFVGKDEESSDTNSFYTLVRANKQ